MTKVAKTGALTNDRKAGNTAAEIVRDIVRGLYEGRYVAGQRLVEPDLIAHYGVSRSSVREAIKQMTADGIVVSHPFRGAQIRKLSRHEADNLFLITELILGLAARQAAARIDEGNARARIEEAFAAIEVHADEDGHYEFIQHRNRYFRILIDIGRNDELLGLLPRLQVHLIRNRLVVPRADRIKGYREITKAILAGNEDRAEAAARKYVRKTASCVLPSFPV